MKTIAENGKCAWPEKTNWRKGSTLVIKLEFQGMRARSRRKVQPMPRVIPVTRPAGRQGESFSVPIFHEKIEGPIAKEQYLFCKSE